MRSLLPAVPIAVLLAACAPDRAPDPAPADAARDAAPSTAQPAPHPAEPTVAQPAREPSRPPPLLGEAITRAEWAKAANRTDCAPLALASDGGGVAIDAVPRRANFSSGWGVSFDVPGVRSAFGFAGPGLLPEDRADFALQVDALARQWPYVKRWEAGDNLPAGSAAGYGVIGAAPYPATNPAGHRLHSLAYLRIPGQACQYNVWSRISRVHLETILGLLRVVGPEGGAQ
ncbi:MAG: hypothetical protein ABIW16_02030 [Sphingomicrobium sp.]